MLGLAGLGAMGVWVNQLETMHLPGETGRGLQGKVGPSHLDLAVGQWKTFWAVSQHRRSPLWLATMTMIVDSLVFAPAYVVTTVVIMARNTRAISSRRPRLLPMLSLSALLIVIVGALDEVENTLTMVLVRGYWNGTHSKNWVDGLLGVAASVKWLLAFPVILAALLLLLVRGIDAFSRRRHWSPIGFREGSRSYRTRMSEPVEAIAGSTTRLRRAVGEDTAVPICARLEVPVLRSLGRLKVD
jgi:hypothetical protein